MKKIKVMTLLVLVMVCIFIFLNYASVETNIYANKGILNLENSYFLEERVISLNGEWEFYRNKLLEPKDFLVGNDLKPTYIKVPGNWKKAKEKEYSPKGYGTYRLVLTNVNLDKQYGLIKKNIRIASRIYIDGKLLSEDGKPSNYEAEEIMGNVPQTLFFEPKSDTVEIIIQVSNYKYYSGGIVEEIRFGLMENIEKESRRKIIFETVIFAMVIVMGIMHGILASLIPQFQKSRSASVTFTIVVVMFAILNGSLSERIIKLVFPFLSTEILIRIEYVAISLLCMALFESIYLMEKRLLPKIYKNIIVCIYIFFMVAVVFLPMENNRIWMLFSYYTFLVLLLMFIWMLLSYVGSKNLNISVEEHTFLLIIMFIANLYNIDVLLFTLGYKTNMNLALIGCVLYGMTWLALMVYRYNEAYKKNEELSVLLLENYYNLEKTSFHAKRSEMAFLQAQIKPHFLFNSLSGIISLISYNPRRAENLLSNLSEYLRNLFNVDMSCEYIHMESELNIIYAYVNIEKERFRERLDVNFDIDDEITSFMIMPLLIQPLVENAIRHGALKKEFGGIVRLSIKKEERYIIITVEDNGPGFSKKAKNLIYMNESMDIDEHKGIGIKNVMDRLRLYYNEELNIVEKTEGGVKIWFRVPIKEEEREVVEDYNC